MGGFSGPGDSPRGPAVGRDPRLRAFAQAHPGGPLRPGAGLAVTLDEVSGPDRRCAGATDDEALGIASRWAATESWAFAAKLGVVRELIRRRPRPDDECGRVARGDTPTPWERELEHEISAELRISLAAAAKLLYLAWALEARLPRIGDALDEGLVDGGQVRMIVTETDVLTDPAQLAAVEQIILAGRADCKTWVALQRLVALAVCTVDPDGARKRREHAEQESARVRFWRETSGAAALAGYSLPPMRPWPPTPASRPARSATGRPGSPSASTGCASSPSWTCSAASRPMTASPAGRPSRPSRRSQPARLSRPTMRTRQPR